MTTFLRYLSLVALALWIGGLVALGAVAAPTLFDVLQAQDPTTGRDTAGQVFGVILERFQHYAWGCAAVLLLSLGIRAALGPRPRRFAVRLWTVTVMLAGSAATSWYIAPRIDAIRRETSPSIAALADTDPRKIEFGRLHGLSSALLLMTALAGAGLIFVEMRDPH